ncbi:MAG TPA: hypothetical protein VN914_20090 [Polyangia bacterium]|nr:hypothetical protein [Polyangia bacterium]
MSDDRELDRRLAALARAEAEAQAPERVAAALRGQVARRRRRRRAPLVASAGAALVAAVWLVWPAAQPPVLVLAPPARAARLPASFLPIGAFTEIEQGRIVRVEVPAGLVVSFGWPLPAEDDRPRAADVLLGEDGVARAIRFLPASFRTGRSAQGD